MELDGEHGAEETRRGDEEHGEKRDELEGGQVLRWKMGREAAELENLGSSHGGRRRKSGVRGACRKSRPKSRRGHDESRSTIFSLKALWSSVPQVSTGELPTIVTPIGPGAFPIASLMYWSIAAR
ncbi:hypothetical protein ACFX11_032628 [Malus domestica]